MRRSFPFGASFAIVLAGVFLLGIVQIFSIRFESGELYPHYSSRRADPFGTKALHDAFRSIGLESNRVETPFAFREAGYGEEDLLLFVGVDPFNMDSVNDSIWSDFEESVENGATAVVALDVGAVFSDDGASEESTDESADQSEAYPIERDTEESGDSNSESVSGSENEAEQLDDEDLFDSVIGSIGFSFEQWIEERGVMIVSLLDELGKEEALKRMEGSSFLASPANDHAETHLASKALVGFEVADEAAGEWTALYRIDGLPVAIARSFEKGRVVVFADSYAFSNEGLLNDRNSELLVGLLERKSRVSFIEAHLGIVRSRGLIELARANGFGVTLALFLVVAAVFIWRSSFSTMPRIESAADRNSDWDMRHANVAMVNLLAHAVRRSKVCSTAFRQWLSRNRTKVGKERLEEMEALSNRMDEMRNPKDADARDFYRNMARLANAQRK